MDYRKIQITGKSTYIISLPKNWVEENGLEKGDSLAVEEKGEGIWLKTSKARDKVSNIDIAEKDEQFLSRLLITKYIRGSNMVVFRSDSFINATKRRNLKKTSRLLIGMEPFGETSKEIIFKMLMHEDVNLIATVSRMHEMSFSSFKNIIRESKKKKNNRNKELLDSIKKSDDEVDKFYFLLLRQLSTTPTSETIAWVQIIKSMERLSDHIQIIASLLLEEEGLEEMDVYEPLIGLYGKVMTSLRSEYPEMAEEAIKGIEEFRKSEKEILEKMKKRKDKSILLHESFRRVGEYISDIAEGVLNLY